MCNRLPRVREQPAAVACVRRRLSFSHDDHAFLVLVVRESKPLDFHFFSFYKGRWGAARTSRVNNSADTDAPSAGPLSYVPGSHLCVAWLSSDACKVTHFFCYHNETRLTFNNCYHLVTIIDIDRCIHGRQDPGGSSRACRILKAHRGPAASRRLIKGLQAGGGNLGWSGAERRRRVSADARSACGSAAACWRRDGGVCGCFGRLRGGSAGVRGHLKGGSRAFCRHDSGSAAGRKRARAGGSAADSPRQPQPSSRQPQAFHLCKPLT